MGDSEIYKPESEDIVNTMIEHNEQLERELEGEIDIAQIEKGVSDKQREQLYEINGVRADCPVINELDGIDAALKIAKAKKGQDYMKRKMQEFLRGY